MAVSWVLVEGGGETNVPQQWQGLWLDQRGAGLGQATLPSFTPGLTRQSKWVAGAGL